MASSGVSSPSSRRSSSASVPIPSRPSSPSRWSAPRPAACRRLKGISSAVREVCDRHGALLILDEVMCGMGRTGTLHAWEQEGIAPDIQAIAKGLGGGYQPIGAMLASAKIVDALRDGSGAFQHGHTLSGPSHGMRRRARGAARDPRGRIARPGAEHGRPPGGTPGRALRQSPPRRRHSRSRAVSRHRDRGRPRQQGAVRSRAEAACTDQARRSWRAASPVIRPAGRWTAGKAITCCLPPHTSPARRIST